MFEKLIEKIASEKTPTSFIGIGSEIKNRNNSVFNAGLNKAIEVIKSGEPPELDAPNEEGWWWLKNYGAYKIMCVEVFEYNDALYVELFCIQMPIEELKGNGKWIRAIMPKGD
jgi:hypothetical protein